MVTYDIASSVGVPAVAVLPVIPAAEQGTRVLLEELAGQLTGDELIAEVWRALPTADAGQVGVAAFQSSI
jgi:hypothetical protein